jgi:hypothetical protein
MGHDNCGVVGNHLGKEQTWLVSAASFLCSQIHITVLRTASNSDVKVGMLQIMGARQGGSKWDSKHTRVVVVMLMQTQTRNVTPSEVHVLACI